MSTPVGSTPAPITPEARLANDEAKLKKTAKQLEGVFVQQLFKAMRETVPQDEGAVSGGTGEDMFTGLMDQHLAADTPTQWAHGLADAAYKQLRKALPQNAQNAQHAQTGTAPQGAASMAIGAGVKPGPAMPLHPTTAAMPLRSQPAISLTDPVNR